MKSKGAYLMNQSGLMQQATPLLGLILVVLAFAMLTKGRAISINNINIVLLQSCIYMTACMGVTFTISQGNMDMSLGGTMVISCMFAGLIGQTHPELVFPMCILVSVFCQLLVGSLHILLNMPTFVLSFIVMFLGKGIASTIMLQRKETIVLPPSLSFLDNRLVFYSITLVVVLVSYFLSEYTKLGKFNRAIGSNQTAAFASGVPVNNYKMLAFLYSGITLGIASFLMLIRSMGVISQTASGFEINIILLLVVGGISLNGGRNVRVVKAVVGCLLIIFLDNALVMVGISSTEVGLIKGVIFLVAVTISFDRKSMSVIV